MQNQQLVDYVKQQTQGGVTKEVLRKALLDAGWPEADVDDSITSAMPVASAPPASSAAPKEPVSSASSLGAGKTSASGFDPVVVMGGAASSAATNPVVANSSPALGVVDGKFFDESHSEEALHARPAGARIALLVLGALVIVLGGTLGYIYFSFNGKVSALSGAGASSASELASLRSQVSQLTEEKNTLTNQASSLSGERDALLEELSFLATPVGAAAEVSGTVKGTVSAAAGVYTITTPHNVRVTVRNSKDAKVDAALKPLLGNSVTLSGTHRPGTAEITVTAVNGAALTTPPASTSTAPTTP